jgi:2-keto-4-pentenoate hydratase
MDATTKKEIADALQEASANCIAISQLTETYPEISIKDAYEIQLEQVKRYIKNGKVIVGKKIGLTSLAMQSLLGVNEPDYGHLMDDMLVYDDTIIDHALLVQPKVEPEIAFIAQEDIKGPGVTPTDVLRKTFGLVPALEIIDSRIKDWKLRIQDTIADNASSSLFALGGQMIRPLEVDLRLIGMVFQKNGMVVSTAAGAAVLGNPCQAVAWLANKLSAFGDFLRKGDIILSGALVKAEAAKKGDHFSVSFDRLGSACCKFK